MWLEKYEDYYYLKRPEYRKMFSTSRDTDPNVAAWGKTDPELCVWPQCGDWQIEIPCPCARY